VPCRERCREGRDDQMACSFGGDLEAPVGFSIDADEIMGQHASNLLLPMSCFLGSCRSPRAAPEASQKTECLQTRRSPYTDIRGSNANGSPTWTRTKEQVIQDAQIFLP
jgi:hypothetical protein